MGCGYDVEAAATSGDVASATVILEATSPATSEREAAPDAAALVGADTTLLASLLAADAADETALRAADVAEDTTFPMDETALPAADVAEAMALPAAEVTDGTMPAAVYAADMIESDWLLDSAPSNWPRSKPSRSRLYLLHGT